MFKTLKEISIDNKYLHWYINLCQRAFERFQTKQQAKQHFVRIESHHVVPKCFKLPTFIVQFTPREHFVAHRLLVRFLKDPQHRKKMSYALCRLINDKIHTSKDYQYYRNELQQHISGEHNPAFGTTRSKEWKDQRSHKYTGSGNPNYGKSAWNRGQTGMFKHSQITKRHASERMKGNIPHNKGKSFLPHSHYERLANQKKKRVTDGIHSFDSRKAAAEHYNVSPTCITQWIQDVRKPFQWL